MIKLRNGVLYDPKMFPEPNDEIDKPVPISMKEHLDTCRKLREAQVEIDALKAKIVAASRPSI
jgi:hypothetical protein